MYSLMALFGSFVALWGVLAWLACGFFAGHLGDEKGRCGFCWLILGLLFGPLAVLTAAGLPNKGPTRRTHSQCHVCHEFVLPEAMKCRHCLTEFAPDEHSQGRTAAQNDRFEMTSVLKEESASVATSPAVWITVAALVVIVALGLIA